LGFSARASAEVHDAVWATADKSDAASGSGTVLIPVQAAHYNEMMSPAVTE
jgi:hypothetical protein